MGGSLRGFARCRLLALLALVLLGGFSGSTSRLNDDETLEAACQETFVVAEPTRVVRPTTSLYSPLFTDDLVALVDQSGSSASILPLNTGPSSAARLSSPLRV